MVPPVTAITWAEWTRRARYELPETFLQPLAAGLVVLPPSSSLPLMASAASAYNARGHRRHPNTFSAGHSGSPLPPPTAPPSAQAAPPIFTASPHGTTDMHPVTFTPDPIPKDWATVLAATATPSAAHLPLPKPAPTQLQAVIDKLVHLTVSTGRLAFFTPTSDPLTIAVIVNGERCLPARSFLDGGASICVMDAAWASRMGVPVFSTNAELATSTAHGQRVFGITGPVTLQLGSPTSGAHVSFETVCLVTQGMSRLYDLLVSNQVLYNYGAVIDYRTLPVTLTLTRTAEGAPLVLPLGGRP